MTLHEHLLTQLSEEASEIAIDISKSLRFGLEDRNVLNPAGPTNRERLIAELNDLMAIVTLCTENGILPKDWQNAQAQEAKLEKVYKFLLYANDRGTLSTGHSIPTGINKTTRPVQTAPSSGGAALNTIDVPDIILAVAAEWNITAAQITGPRRSQHIADARTAAIGLIHTFFPDLAEPELASHFRISRSGVGYAVRRYKDFRETDPSFRAQTDTLLATLTTNH
jgi:hypothetical protein